MKKIVMQSVNGMGLTLDPTMKKEVCAWHGSTARLLALPDLLRHVRLWLWLRNRFPGLVIESPLSVIRPHFAMRWNRTGPNGLEGKALI